MKVCKKYSVFFVLLSFIFHSCEQENAVQAKRISGEALGTTYNIIYFSEKEFDLEKGIDSIIEVVNNSMSTYRETSDISKINKGDTSIVVDGHFKKVFQFSKKVHRESRGYFDPTVGNLVNAFGFGAEQGLKTLNSATVDSLLLYVGLDKVTITPEGLMKKDLPGVYLEFNAIAKGYAVDLLAEFLESKNVENYLVELGGELYAKGRNLAKNSNWIVAIDDPQQTALERTFQATLELKNRAMATSGNYRKYRIDPNTGEKFVHTINPLTGYPEKSNVLSVSILAENCALADAYATACMAMGLEKSKEMLSQLENVDAYIIYSEENEEYAVFATPGFEKVILE